MSMPPTTEEAKTSALVDWDHLNDLFAQMPSGPWDASRDTGGHEIRQIDTDPTNKHHWPFRLCRSVPGQRSACDDAVFNFIAGVLNAWPQIAAARSEESQIEHILAMPEDELRKRCLVDGQSPEQSVRIADFAFECASLRAALIRISDQYVTHRGDLEDDKALKAIKSIADTALAAPRADSADRTAGEFRFTTNELREIREAIRELGEGAIRTQKITDHQAASDIQRHCIQRIERALASRSASLAPSSPGVPDSVRAAFLAADLHECWVNGDTADVMTSPFPGCGNFNQIVARCATGDLWRKRAVAIAEALNFVRTLISAQPAGQSDDDAERCIACDKPLKAGERVLPDAEGGTIHTACCGPEREGYTKGDGEPLGPNDPIPQGYAYEPVHPDGQSTGQGADEKAYIEQRRDFWLNEAYRLAVLVRKLGGDPEAKPAPDSTRTGQVETEEVEKLAWIILANLRTDVSVTDLRRKLDEEQSGKFGLGRSWCQALDTARRQARAILAARPAAPEAQGAWKHSNEEPEIGRRHVRLYEDGSGAVLLVRHDGGLLDAEGCEFEPRSEFPLGPWAYTPDGFRLWAEDHGDSQITLSAPPASSSSSSSSSSSGQESA